MIIITVIWFLSWVLFPKFNYNYQQFLSIGLQCCFLLIGFLSTKNRYHPKDEIIFSFSGIPSEYLLKILDNPQEKVNSVKCLCAIEREIDGEMIDEKAVIYFQKSGKANSLKSGDLIVVQTIFSRIAPPQNPNSFDYQKYMQKKRVFYTGYIPESRFSVIGNFPVQPLRQFAYRLQQYFSQLLARSGLEGDEYSIITAILLGNDETMDPSLRASYTAAGVNHILCVSGMHVGIIFMILNFLLKPLEANRKTKIAKALILIFCVWGYAHITGLSPSVQRASAMFTFVVFGNFLNRHTNVFHSLFASLFILLSINPLLLFEVGFQLSYLAVFGIVIFQKPICSLWTPKNKIISYFWELAAVSFSAQIGTFPIAIYYFGQFPNYFLLANLSVIMLSTLIVISGIVVLVFSFSPLLASWAGKLLCYEIKGMNGIISFIESLPGAVTPNISYNLCQVFLLYIAIFFGYLLFSKKRKSYYWIALSSVSIFSLLFVFQSIKSSLESSVTIYSIPKKMAVNFNHHGKSILLHDFMESKDDPDYQFSIINHERKAGIKSCLLAKSEDLTNPDGLFFKEGNFVRFKNQTFYFLSEQPKLYATTLKIRIDYLYLYQHPKIKPEELMEIVEFKYLIIGRGLSGYYENLWREFCIKENIEYHSIQESGAFVIRN